MDPNVASPFPPVSEKQHRTTKLLILSGLGLLLITCLGLIYARAQANNADRVFWQSFDTSLTTRSVTQITTSADSTVQVLYDVADPKAPRVSTVANIDGSSTILRGYGTLQDTFLYIDPIKDPLTAVEKKLNATTFGRMVQARANGKLAANYSKTNLMNSLVEPRRLLFGDYIFGNFKPADRQALIAAVRDNKVYSFDSKTVKKTTLHGTPVYAYNVTISKDALQQYNEQAAPLFGLPKAEIDNNFDTVASSLKATWYVDIERTQLVKIVLPDDRGVTVYSAYNKTTPKTPPSDYPSLSWSDFTATLQAAQ